MINVAHISTFLPTQCGIATYSHDLLESLSRIYPSYNTVPFRLCHPNENYSDIENQIHNTKKDSFLAAVNVINKSDLDVVDIQHEYKIYGPPDGENINILFDNITKPIVTTLHTVSKSLNQSRLFTFEKILRRSNHLMVFSSLTREYLLSKFNCSGDKISVIPHGVPKVSFKLPLEIEQRKITTAEVVFISFGHLREAKGYEHALTSLFKIRNEIPKFHYFIIGSNHPQNTEALSYRKKLEELIDTYNMNKEVTFIDEYLDQKQLIEYIQLSDIGLLPYNRKDQCSSGVLALIIACGRLVVANPFEFANSLVSPSVGCLAAGFTCEDFMDSILSIIARKNKWIDMMKNNFMLAREWQWENIASIYYKIYQDLKSIK